MNLNARSVFEAWPQSLKRLNRKWIGAAVGLVAVAGLAAFGVAGGSDPMHATVAPLSGAEVAPLVAYNNAIEKVTAQITPSVVRIFVESKVPTSQAGPMGDMGQGQQQMPDLPPGFQQFFRRFQGPQQQQPQFEQGIGSGVIVSPDGYIVTNNHVVDGATQVEVTLSDDRVFPAKVVGTDKDTDLAVVKIDASGLPSAPWGDSSLLKQGETVLAIGNPLNMNFTVTRGIVSAINRNRDQSANGADTRGTFIQTDASINPGNSGGPLVNVYGEVVGINTEMLSSDGGGYAGIGFAIPSDLVRPTADELIRTGKVVRGYLGIQVTDVTPDLAESLGISGHKGALVNQVNPGSPAESVGLKRYDVITNVNGKTVTNGTDLQQLVGENAPGSSVNLGILRDGKAMTLAAKLTDSAGAADASQPADTASAASSNASPQLGITSEPLTSDMRGQFHIPASVQGLAVEQVTPGSPADLAGITPGDVIEQVNRHSVATVQGLQEQLSAAPANAPLLLLDHKSNGDFIIPVRPQPAGN